MQTPRALVLILAMLLPVPVLAQGSLADYNAHLRKINRLSAEDWYQLGLWCKSKMMWPYANQAFMKASALGSSLRAKSFYQLAEIAFGQQKDAEAAEWIAKAAKAAPEDAQIKRLSGRILGRREAKTASGIRAIKEAHEANRHNDFINAVIAFVGKPGHDTMEQHQEELTEALDEEVFKCLVAHRMKSTCPRCGEGGFYRCPECLGKGYKISKYVKRTISAYQAGTVATERKKVLKMCRKCKGIGAVQCGECGGAGMYLKYVYDGEKTLLAKALAEKAVAKLSKRKRRSQRKKKDDVAGDLRRAVKLSAMLKKALKLDKEGVTASVEKLDRALSRAESNLEKAQRKVEEAVDKKLEEIAEERGATYVKEKDKKGKKK